MLTYLCSRSQLGAPNRVLGPKALVWRWQGLGVAPIQLVGNEVDESEWFGLWSSMSEVFSRVSKLGNFELADSTRG